MNASLEERLAELVREARAAGRLEALEQSFRELTAVTNVRNGAPSSGVFQTQLLAANMHPPLITRDY